MLYIVDGEKYTKISGMDLAKKFKVDAYIVQMLSTKASFRQNTKRLKKDRVNPNMTKTNEFTKFPSNFSFIDPDDKTMKFIHYAESDNPNRKTGKPELNPKKVEFSGKVFNFTNQFDKALFFYLHKFNLSSPLNNGNKKAEGSSLYNLVNRRQEAKDDMTKLNFLEIALIEYKKLSANEIKYVTRALGLARNVDAMEQEELAYILKKHAATYPEKFINNLGTARALNLKGRILNLIDRGHFQLKPLGAGKQWTVATGQFEGTRVGEPIIGNLQDPNEHLFSAISNNLEEYSDLIKDVYIAQDNQKDLDDKISQSGLLEDLESDKPHPVSESVIPEPTIEAVEEFLKANNKSVGQLKANVKLVVDLIKSGQFNDLTYKALLKNIPDKK